MDWTLLKWSPDTPISIGISQTSTSGLSEDDGNLSEQSDVMISYVQEWVYLKDIANRSQGLTSANWQALPFFQPGAQVYIKLFRREQVVSPRGKDLMRHPEPPTLLPEGELSWIHANDAKTGAEHPSQDSWRRQILQVTLRISRANSQVPEVASITKWTAFPKITHQETSLSLISPSLLLRLPVYTHWREKKQQKIIQHALRHSLSGLTRSCSFSLSFSLSSSPLNTTLFLSLSFSSL